MAAAPRRSKSSAWLEWVEKLKEDPLPYTYSDKKASVLIDLSDALLIQGDAAGSSDAAKEAIGLLDQPPFERNSSPHDAFTRWLIGLARIIAAWHKTNWAIRRKRKKVSGGSGAGR